MSMEDKLLNALTEQDHPQHEEAYDRIETAVFSAFENVAFTLEEEYTTRDNQKFADRFIQRGLDNSEQQMEEMDRLTEEESNSDAEAEPDLIERALAPDPTETRIATGQVDGEELTLVRNTEHTANHESIHYVKVFDDWDGNAEAVALEKDSFDTAEASLDYWEELVDAYGFTEDE